MSKHNIKVGLVQDKSLELNKVIKMNERFFEGIDQKSAGFYTSRKVDEQKYCTDKTTMKKSDKLDKPQRKEGKLATQTP